MKFTDRAIKALKARQVRYEVFADNERGFGLRVSESGLKTWVTRYQLNGRPVKLTHGTYPTMSLADARAKHNEHRKLLHNGLDPRDELERLRMEAKKIRLAEAEAGTVAQLAHEYMERHAKKKKRSWQEDQRILRKDILPAWGNHRAKDITRRDVIRLLDKIVDRGAPVMANRTLGVISKMFTVGVRRGIVDASPCVAIDPPGEEGSRDRVLNEDEIQAFWGGLNNARAHRSIKLALKLQLVTAQRRGEIAGAAWSEFHLTTGWWTIPAERSKNRLAHRVPLSPLALELLAELKALAGGSRWLIPSPRGDVPIRNAALTRAISNNRDVFKVPPFTPHDLRRTAASMMTSMGILRLVVKKILNHVEGDVTAIYDRHSYDNEKRQALEKWANKLRDIIDGQVGKIVTLKGV